MNCRKSGSAAARVMSRDGEKCPPSHQSFSFYSIFSFFELTAIYYIGMDYFKAVLTLTYIQQT